MTIRRQHLLASTLFTAVALAAAPAFAQPATTSTSDEQSTQVGEVVVTGTRIPKNEFNSANPVQVLTTDKAQAAGVADTVQFLQNSTIAAGSPQVNSIISTAFVTNGGPGAATISLRGLGANRTLVLLNGRRAGPAGTRGGVSSFDLNTLPESSIDHIDILKDGASSIYGSDAVAGVVNIITKKSRNGGELTAFWSDPTDTGGEQADFSASFGKTWDRFRFSVAADYYKQYELQNGERSYTQCAEQYIFNPTTLQRSDDIDPRTGKFHCSDVDDGHVWVYGYQYGTGPGPGRGPQGYFTTRAGRFQANLDNNLQNFIPRYPGLPGDGVCNTAARSTDPDCYPGAPSNFFVVGYNPLTRSVTDANNPLEDKASLIPETDRTTFFGDAAFDLNNTTQIYTELLANRRETKTHGFRQYWTYNYTASGEDPGVGTDPFSVGWTGPFLLSPTPTTDWFGSETRVDYTRAVLGIRGSFSWLNLKDWSWDLYGQASRSLGTYTQQVILDDAIRSQSYRTQSCVGTTTPISHRPCIDINFTDPAVLTGHLTDAQKAFLFDTDVGKTKYNQNYLEGSIAGNWFDLPAGPIGASVGFHYAEDKINDVPGAITLAGNSWGLTSAGITAGTEKTTEGFAELSIPLLKDHFLVKQMGMSLSGRYTDVDIAGSRSTYKLGLNWQVDDNFRIRFTRGTSFRAPALFELYLADQTDFQDQRTVDPCVNWAQNLQDGLISQRLADNCNNPAGPGGGVPGNLAAGGASAEIHTSGGLGILKPESSMSTVWGVVYTPSYFKRFSLAVDYFDIHVKNEVTTLGTNIPFVCYNSLNFPTDPVCNLFVRNSGTNRIDLILDQYINIADQRTRGIDTAIKYGHALPWNTDLVLDGQFTWRLQDTTALFPGAEVDNNHRIGYPQFSGDVDATFTHGPFTLAYGAQLIGQQSSFKDYGRPDIVINGVSHLVKADADLVAFHHVSLRYDWEKQGASFLIGVANLYDKAPPSVTTVSSGLGLYNTVGTSLLTSQYNEGFLGRRFFARVSKKF